MQRPLENITKQVAKLLGQLRRKSGFARSCTDGLVSATLARILGITNCYCGSAVAYRLDSKASWLNVPQSMRADPGAISEPVARATAEGVLETTPEADVSASITGHLDPNALVNGDRLVYVGIAIRGRRCNVIEHRRQPVVPGAAVSLYPGESEREQRQ